MNVEFKEQGFKWRDVSEVEIDFEGSVRRDGEVVRVPGVLATR